MPDVSLDFRYLRYVFLVAQFGSFRAAAESENMTQSTISRRVSILERRVGVKLFERNHNGARLTAAGERFVQTAAYSAEQLRETIREVRETVRGEIGQLRIGLMTFGNGDVSVKPFSACDVGRRVCGFHQLCTLSRPAFAWAFW